MFQTFDRIVVRPCDIQYIECDESPAIGDKAARWTLKITLSGCNYVYLYLDSKESAIEWMGKLAAAANHTP